MKYLILFYLLFLTPTFGADRMQQGSMISGRSEVVSSGGSTTLTKLSDNYQDLTGALTHTIVLPDATTLIQDRTFQIVNNSAQDLSVQFSDNSAAKTVAPLECGWFKVIDNSTAVGAWNIVLMMAGIAIETDPLSMHLDGSTAMAAAMPMGGFAITGMADPVNPQDGATRNFVLGQGFLTSFTELDPLSYSKVLLDGGQLDNRYYTETELDAGQLDNRYYTEIELDAGQLDNRYYTETELDAGQLDNQYFQKSEFLTTSAGAGDSGKPLILNASGIVDSTMLPVPNLGDVVGPGSSTDNAMAIWDGVTGELLKDSFLTVGTIHQSATPTASSIHAISGLGTNIGGANLTVAAGQSTGLAGGGHIIFQTALAGLTGSALNTLITRLEIEDTGRIKFNTDQLILNTDGTLELNGTPFQGDDSGIQNLFIGSSPTTSGTSNTGLGFLAGSSLSSGNNNTFVGSKAGDNITTGGGNTILGSGSVGNSAMVFSIFIGLRSGLNSTGNNNIFIGSFIGENHQGNQNIAIGVSAASGGFTNNTVNNEMIIGARASPITVSYWGESGRSSTPGSFSFNGTQSAGTNLNAGANFDFNGARGSGTGTGSHIRLRTAPAGLTGSSVNALVTRLEIEDTGRIAFNTDQLILQTGGLILMATGNLDLTGGELLVDSVQVVSSRVTGWTAATGIADRTTFATGSATTQSNAEHIKAIIDDLIAHGLIGA